MLKRLIAVMAMAVLVLSGGICLGLLTESNGEVMPAVKGVGEVRAMECVVVGEDENVMVLEDECNNLWLLDAGELCKDDVLHVWLDDMNTPKDLTDDVILDYCNVVVD